MEIKWSLKELYPSFDSKEFKEDLKSYENYIDEYKKWVDSISENKKDINKKLEQLIDIETKGEILYTKLKYYSELTLSVDTKNSSAAKNLEVIQNITAGKAEQDAKLWRWIGEIDNLQEVANSSDKLKEFSFHINELAHRSKYLLSDREEGIIAKMKSTGSTAWSKLKDLETSNLMVDIELDGKMQQLPLTVVRNMAYDERADVRKTAYEAEMKSYSKIEDTVAACLNGIKGEVITTSKLKGYESPLEKTLIDSRMDKKTLEVMIEAIKESLPEFRKYFKKKAELLGYKNGLPFYDLFAPIGSSDKKFDYEQGQKFVENNFRTFSDRLADFAHKAIANNWIDVYPREGKVGGAFCENINAIGESRFMLNYGNQFTDVVTMAHELGHGYHGECLKNENILNSDYPMPIAETASTFCETIIKKAALKDASKEEAILIFETEISDCAQVIVDIYSRFLFETEVFEKRRDSSLSASELNDIMLKAQLQSYGDGLDPNYLHKSMWVCKPHYYYADTNFYNFPYAFGQLFSKGLYAEYVKSGDAFVEKYDELLAATGKNNLSDVAKLVNIDLNDINFWRKSLQSIYEDIDKFISLTK
ncbi:M3 family oligoendopeptidase [Clostridium oryzae]|uniref:Oligoendopeptidase F, plasmid n=1 Tax=Clostridium oryzae TaxID=1450648 RepID=A0A1V4ISQ4_9CLOT|nr:M3 family oligoendopeptidase [Clostridium oryzae]OPJ63042.1 oligoendopeptidase F, plasmid [Clostridium oryzae]